MVKEVDILLNAFRPATEMDDPRLFTGRSKEIKSMAEALHVSGGAPLIYGDRGLGKSSLALQLGLVAMGDTKLLDEYDLGRYSFALDDSWLAFYVSCTSETRGVPDVIQRLINSVSSVTLKDRDRDTDQLVDRTTTWKISLKVFERETSNRYEAQVAERAHENLGLEERLLELCRTLTKETGNRVLLIVDELDRLQNPTGLASLVKTASSQELKFMLVGIAQNLSDLLDDHQSVERLMSPVHVQPMTESELGEIIDRALDHLAEHRFGFEFSPDVRARIASLACGFPWFVHVLGQASLMEAYDADNRVVTEEHLALAIHSLTNNRFAQQFSDLYQTAVRDSPQREMVLRTFAQWRARDIPTGAIYPVLRERLGVLNPSAYKGHLASEAYGQTLLIPPFQSRALVRFRNEMFKVYVRLRSPIFNASLAVEQAWLDSGQGPG